ncbi:MAG: hypothetical protein LBJ80_00165 [Rickettsiales bacterium]|jgi:hypothetical protein|nr:hypothetical protein [Rickettsiales bacterium]
MKYKIEKKRLLLWSALLGGLILFGLALDSNTKVKNEDEKIVESTKY